MKTKIWFYLLLITLWGCDKGSSEDPIVYQPKIYTATLIIKGVGEEKIQKTSVKAGEIASFRVVQYPGYNRVSVVVNGVVQPLPLSETYELTVVSDLNIEFEYVSDKVFALIKAPIYVQKIEQQETQTGTGIWVTMIPDLDSTFFYQIFTSDGIWRMYDKSGTLIGGPHKWYLTDKGIVVSSSHYDLITFNTDGTIVVEFVIGVLGSPDKKINMRETWGATSIQVPS